MANISKVRDPRFWIRWYASGAVKQKDYPEGALHIEAMGIHYGGPARGHTTLSLGSRVLNCGPGWSVNEPLCAVVVPSSEKHELGKVLPAIPKNAIPVDVFFWK